jgi:DNA-binding IclR family transcriptional regulator
MSMIPDIDDDSRIKSVDRTFRIIEAIQEAEGARIADLADEFQMAKSTIHRHLKTLEQHGYVVNEGGTYQIGLRFLDPAIHARYRREEYRLIEPKVELLAHETGERAQFITEENGLGIHVHSEVGKSGILTESRVGKMVYLHATSVGKSILAKLPEQRVDEIIAQHGLPKLTDNTTTVPEELKRELERVRDRGYAFNKAERRQGMEAIGVPVTTPTGTVLGGISVTGPVRRMESEHEDYLPDMLLDIAEEIKLRLEYPQR